MRTRADYIQEIRKIQRTEFSFQDFKHRNYGIHQATDIINEMTNRQRWAVLFFAQSKVQDWKEKNLTNQ